MSGSLGALVCFFADEQHSWNAIHEDKLDYLISTGLLSAAQPNPTIRIVAIDVMTIER